MLLDFPQNLIAEQSHLVDGNIVEPTHVLLGMLESLLLHFSHIGMAWQGEHVYDWAGSMHWCAIDILTGRLECWMVVDFTALTFKDFHY